MGLTPTTEDYLQAIDGLTTEGENVIAARIAQRLHVSAASVSQTIDRMSKQGLLAVDEDHRIEFTLSGRSAADSILRRHRLTERFLVDLLQLGWAEAHEEAHRLEHGMSDLVQERLSMLLSNPRTCPHGAPIPGNFPEGGDRNWIPLDILRPGDGATIVRISEAIEEDAELLQYCETKALCPGTPVSVSEVGPDGVRMLDVQGAAVAVSERLSAHIFCVAGLPAARATSKGTSS